MNAAANSLAGRGAPCTGVILAGGGATRFGGTAKGLEHVGGVRILDRVAAALAQAADHLLLIANTPEAAHWLPGVAVAGDVRRGDGSLGGVHAALVHTGTPVLVVAWDMPFVPAALLRRLRALGEADVDAEVGAVLPASRMHRGIEPMCAWYHPRCLPAITRRLDGGDRRMVSFLEDVRCATLPLDEVCAFGEPEILFMNVNTADDLARANTHAAFPGHRA